MMLTAYGYPLLINNLGVVTNYFYLSHLVIAFVSANSADPDDMSHSVAFHWAFTVCQINRLLLQLVTIRIETTTGYIVFLL